MKLNEVFPSNYLKADDLKGARPTVVIKEAQMELLGKENKLILYFENKDKGMVCNKTNAGRISDLYGDDTEDWIGKPILLTSEYVDFQGKSMKALRVQPPASARGASSPAAPPASAPRPAPIANRTTAYTEIDPPPPDDIPF